MTQMRRWGQIPDAKPDSWYLDMAKKVFRPDIYRQAAADLIKDGKMKPSDFPNFKTETGFRAVKATTFIDGIPFDGRKPNAYINSFPIGLKGNQTP